MSQIPPCRSCPWRKSTRTKDIPGGGLDHYKCAETDTETMTGQLPTVMACHLTTDEDPRACAGFVVQVGTRDSVGLRIAQLLGFVNPDDYCDGGADLHANMAEMMAAHPHR